MINKMDLADKEDPSRKKFGEKKAEILAINEKVSKEKDRKGHIRLFGTTIWDESLYKVSPIRHDHNVVLTTRHGHQSSTRWYPISTSSHPTSHIYVTYASLSK